MTMRHRHGVQAIGTGHVHGVGSKDTASQTSPASLPPVLNRVGSNLRNLLLPHSAMGPPAHPHTLPWLQRGLSGSESLLLLLLPPLSESGLPRDGEPTSEGGGVGISITSAFATSMDASALGPAPQEATRSLRDSMGSGTGFREGPITPKPALTVPAWHSLLFCTAIFRLRFSCFSFWLLCCRKRMYSMAFLRIADLLSCEGQRTAQPHAQPLPRPPHPHTAPTLASVPTTRSFSSTILSLMDER